MGPGECLYLRKQVRVHTGEPEDLLVDVADDKRIDLGFGE